MNQPRQHRTEIKAALKLVTDQALRETILEIFNDLQKQRNLHRDQLTIERAAHKKLKDERRGVVRDVDYSVNYVLKRISGYDSFKLYHDVNADRFCVMRKREPLVDGYQLLGVYTKPYDRQMIRDDIEFYLKGESK